MAVSHVKSNPIADFTGTVTAFNSQGSTITVNATDIVRPSDWNSAHNFYQTISGNTAGQSTISGTNLVFQGGNGITLSAATAAGAATIVVSGSNQTVQPVAVSGSNGSFAFSTATFGNLNGLSFYTSNGSMVGSYTVPAAQTNQSLGLYAGSNTTGQSSSTTVDARSLSFRGAGVASVGYSGGEVLISVPAGGGAGDGYNILAAGTQTATTAGSVLFENSNGITFGMSGSTRITASHNGLTTARASTDAIGLNTAQSNVTWTVNSSGLSLDARGYAGTATAVTGGAAVTVNSNGVSFNGASLAGTSTGFTGANISGSMTHNTAGLALSLSVAAPGGGGGAALSAGTQSGNTGTIVFANSNGLTFGMSGSSQITGSYTVPTQTAQSIGVYATSNTTGQSSSSTYDARSLTIRGYGVLSVGNSNGSILLSTPDPVVFTQLSVGNSTGGNTSGNSGVVTGQLVLAGGNNITLSGSTNAGSMTITISGGAGGGGGVGLSAGTQSVSTGTVAFANSNGISFGMSGSNQITASYTVPTQTAQTVGIYASSNTTGQSSSSTVDARSFSIVGAGAASVGMSGGSFVISAPNAGAGNVTFSAGANSAGLASLVFSNANGVSFGLNGSTITASAAGGGGGGIGGGVSNLGNTAGSTGTVTTGNIVFVGSGPISLSQSTGAAGSAATISILGPATSSLVGVNGISLSTNGSTISVSYTGGIQSNFRAFEPGNNSTYSSLGQNTVQMQHFLPEDQIYMSYAEIWARGSYVSSTNSQVYAQTISYGIYSQGTGANSTQMSLAGSSSMSMNVSFNSNTAAGYTIGNGATSITSSSGGTALMSNISGPFHLYMPFSTTLQPNVKHALALAVSSATTVGTSPFRFAVLVQTIQNSLSHGRIFVSSVVAPATSVIGDREMGVYTATSGALPNTYGTANISIAVSRQQLPFMLEV